MLSTLYFTDALQSLNHSRCWFFDDDGNDGEFFDASSPSLSMAEFRASRRR